MIRVFVEEAVALVAIVLFGATVMLWAGFFSRCATLACASAGLN